MGKVFDMAGAAHENLLAPIVVADEKLQRLHVISK